ncbi:hypothetical protein, partial [Paracoccus rhizosphaerae]
ASRTAASAHQIKTVGVVQAGLINEIMPLRTRQSSAWSLPFGKNDFQTVHLGVALPEKSLIVQVAEPEPY